MANMGPGAASMAVNAAAFDFGPSPAKPEPAFAGAGFGDDKLSKEPAMDYSSPAKQDPYQHHVDPTSSNQVNSYSNSQAYGMDSGGGTNAYDENNYNYYGQEQAYGGYQQDSYGYGGQDYGADPGLQKQETGIDNELEEYLKSRKEATEAKRKQEEADHLGGSAAAGVSGVTDGGQVQPQQPPPQSSPFDFDDQSQPASNPPAAPQGQTGNFGEFDF